MRGQNDGAMRQLLLSIVTVWLPTAAAIAVSPAHSRNAVSLVARSLRRGSSSSGARAGMGRVVAHGKSLYMNTAIPGQIWKLAPNWDTNAWTWSPAGNAFQNGDNPGTPLNYPVNMFPGPAPMPAPAAASPAASPGPAPGPGAAPVSCSSLIGLAESNPAAKGMFLGCKEFHYYGEGSLGKAAPYGCHCASWTVNCPFETCPLGSAFDEMCLDPTVKALGFTSLSKMTNFISPASVPKTLRPYTVHPDYVSTCMYWLPKPSQPGLPPVSTSFFDTILPDFGTFYFDSISFAQCAVQIKDEFNLGLVKTNLLKALGEAGLSVISITCGSMSALVTGPKDQLLRAAAKAKSPKFCFQGSTMLVCTMATKDEQAAKFTGWLGSVPFYGGAGGAGMMPMVSSIPVMYGPAGPGGPGGPSPSAPAPAPAR